MTSPGCFLARPVLAQVGTSDADCLRPREARLTHHELDPARLEVAEVHLDEPVDHCPFASENAGHVDLHGPGHDAEPVFRIDERHGLRAVDDVLARQTRDVRTGAADHRALDDGRLLPGSSQVPREDLACLAAADDEVPIGLDRHVPLLRLRFRRP